MKTTLHLDDELLEKAQRLTGISKKSSLIHVALSCLMRRESANRLATLEGSEPHLEQIPRRRAAK